MAEAMNRTVMPKRYLRLEMKAPQIVRCVPRMGGAKPIMAKGLDPTIGFLSGMIPFHPSGIEGLRRVLRSEGRKYFDNALVHFLKFGNGREIDQLTAHAMELFFGSALMHESLLWKHISVREFAAELNGEIVAVPAVFSRRFAPVYGSLFPILAAGSFWNVQHHGHVPSVQATIKMPIDIGLHLLACSKLAEVASGYKSDLTVTSLTENVKANGAETLSLLSLRVMCGERITIKADGPDAGELMGEVMKFFYSYKPPLDGWDVYP